MVSATELLRERYALVPSGLQRLGGSDNDLYRVDLQGSPTYALRVQRGFQPGEVAEAHAAFEFDWLTGLRREGVRAPEPLRTVDGARCSTLPNGEVALLFRWLPGEPLGRPDPAAANAAGRALARLHDASRARPVPRRCATRWDSRGLSGPSSWLVRHASAELDAHALGLLHFARDAVVRVEQELGGDARTYGVIHSDPHHANLLRHEGELAFIDFAECGYGYYAFDLATFLHESIDTGSGSPPLVEPLLEGYRQLAELPLQQVEQLDAFVLARILAWFAWELRSEDPRERARALAAGWAPDLLAQLDSFKSGGRLLESG